jgi:hypothetical protein
VTEGLDIRASTLRKLEVGETLEALDTPVVEPSAGLLRVRIRCERDGTSGFVTVRIRQGAALLEPVGPSLVAGPCGPD